MSLNKKQISKNISTELDLSFSDSKFFCDTFINILKNKSFTTTVKIHDFGTFYLHKTPKRTGRNPKTRESYIIQSREKVCFKSSIKIKKILN